MKVMLVSSRVDVHHRKYIENLSSALIKKKYDIFELSSGRVPLRTARYITRLEDHDFQYFSNIQDEHQYLRVFEIAKKHKIDIVHFCRLCDPQRLFTALQVYGDVTFGMSATIFGLTEFLRRPIYGYFFKKLLRHRKFNRLLVYSNYPKSLHKTARISEIPFKKIRYLTDPVYDNKKLYDISRATARKILKLRQKDFILLYFGAYFFSKGPDIVLKAARRMTSKGNFKFIMAGDTSVTSFKFDMSLCKNLKNVILYDRWIKENEAPLFFGASDAVLLPYRKFYEHGSSGVIVQSCLAKRPVILPHISPFSELLNRYNIGKTFSCESIPSLCALLKRLYSSGIDKFDGYDDYLSSFETWDKAAEYITM